jgi:hypothetical protein
MLKARRTIAACQSLHRAWRRAQGIRRVMQDAINAGYDRTSEVIKERDALRSEVERLKAALAAEHDVVVRQLDCMAGQLRQRDEYKAEADRLRAVEKAARGLEPLLNDSCECAGVRCPGAWVRALRAALAATKGGG